LKPTPNRYYQRFYYYALAGFAALSLGYLLREQISSANALVIGLLGILPNLTGSFATPFLLAYLLVWGYPALKALDRFWVFGLINLFTFAACLFIEYLHVAFQSGTWDNNDIAASAVGGLVSLVLFYGTRAGAGKRLSTNGRERFIA